VRQPFSPAKVFVRIGQLTFSGNPNLPASAGNQLSNDAPGAARANESVGSPLVARVKSRLLALRVKSVSITYLFQYN
jgi:hypothetical protein